MKPEYYQTATLDVIDICKLYDLNFNKGNVLKYVCRAGRKDNEIQDLIKAKEYIEREISHLKSKI
tara:strand:- start:64 stop:258 length:195 start_codon:yes stop_codon:yes gene_type:complete